MNKKLIIAIVCASGAWMISALDFSSGSRPLIGFQGSAAFAAAEAQKPSQAAVPAEPVDPWDKLRRQIENQPEPPLPPAVETEDPWAKLRAIYLPFTEEEEFEAAIDPVVRQKVSKGLHAALDPYADLIRKASDLFNVPQEIIAAVIMVESGGDPKARAKTSSAAGLMQTISGTFTDARTSLKNREIHISESPYDPESSIFAGTWYLDRMYDRARRDKPGEVGPRDSIAAWKYPLEYYYAGPGYGARRDPVVIIYSGGKKVVVDKPAYSSKALKWAGIMSRNAT